MKKQKGFMLLEILIASSLITLVVLGVMAVAQKTIEVSRRALHNQEAQYLLEEGAEVMRILRDDNWANVGDLNQGQEYYFSWNGGSWSLSPSSSLVGIFTRKVVVANVSRDPVGKISANGTNDPGTKLITVTVSWQEGGNQVSKTVQLYLVDIFS